MTENQIVFLWPPEQFRYWRESTISVPASGNQFLIEGRHKLGPDGSATMAYSVADGQTVRYWWLWQPSQCDGIDPPHELDSTPFKFVDPKSIKLNAASSPWRPLSHTSLMRGRLTQPPINLLRRWGEWECRHRPRIPTRWQRFVSWCSGLWRKAFYGR